MPLATGTPRLSTATNADGIFVSTGTWTPAADNVDIIAVSAVVPDDAVTAVLPDPDPFSGSEGSDTVTTAPPDAAPAAVSDAVPAAVPDAVSVAVPFHAVSDQISDSVPAAVSDAVSDLVPDAVTDLVPDLTDQMTIARYLEDDGSATAVDFIGGFVRILNLKMRPELNGSIGKVTSFCARSSRFGVITSSSAPALAISPRNVTSINDPTMVSCPICHRGSERLPHDYCPFCGASGNERLSALPADHPYFIFEQHLNDL